MALPVLVLALTVFCLNRVILMGVAWILGGALANLSELAAHGAVVDFISHSGPVRASLRSATSVSWWGSCSWPLAHSWSSHTLARGVGMRVSATAVELLVPRLFGDRPIELRTDATAVLPAR